jgi:primase-polymerase (primpol)-like protein
MGSVEQETHSKETFLTQTTTGVLSAQFSTDVQIDLRQYDQWVLWRGADRIDKKTGEVTGLDKVPYTVHLYKASTTNPYTWASFDQCVKALPAALEEWEAEDPSAYREGGLGFVLTANDPFTGIDFDHCRNPETGDIAPWAQQIVNALKSYTEVSPSGTGLRLFVRGKLPKEIGHNASPVEIYDRTKYLTVTGNHLPGTPTTITERQAGIELLYDAASIIAKALQQYGERFNLLFAGKWEKAARGDGSPFPRCLFRKSSARIVEPSKDVAWGMLRAW